MDRWDSLLIKARAEMTSTAFTRKPLSKSDMFDLAWDHFLKMELEKDARAAARRQMQARQDAKDRAQARGEKRRQFVSDAERGLRDAGSRLGRGMMNTARAGAQGFRQGMEDYRTRRAARATPPTMQQPEAPDTSAMGRLRSVMGDESVPQVEATPPGLNPRGMSTDDMSYLQDLKQRGPSTPSPAPASEPREPMRYSTDRLKPRGPGSRTGSGEGYMPPKRPRRPGRDMPMQSVEPEAMPMRALSAPERRLALPAPRSPMPEGRQLPKDAVGPAAQGRPPQKGTRGMMREGRKGFDGPGVDQPTQPREATPDPTIAAAKERRAKRKARVRPPEPPAPKPKAPAPKPKAKAPAPKRKPKAKPPAPKPKEPAGGGGQPTDLFGGAGDEVPVPSEPVKQPEKTEGSSEMPWQEVLGMSFRELEDKVGGWEKASTMREQARQQRDAAEGIKRASDADYSLLPTGMRNTLLKQNAPEQDDTNFSLLPRGWNEGGLQ